jgi:hypothetical protein
VTFGDVPPRVAMPHWHASIRRLRMRLIHRGILLCFALLATAPALGLGSGWVTASWPIWPAGS